MPRLLYAMLAADALMLCHDAASPCSAADAFFAATPFRHRYMLPYVSLRLRRYATLLADFSLT